MIISGQRIYYHELKQINMIINDAKELRELTGSYYANNDFSKITGDIELATEELEKIVGSALIARLEKFKSEDADLLRKVQRPVAILATLRLYQKNDLSHEDDGRKIKTATDGSEKTPWEWQLDRDDAMHLEEYYRATDTLIRYLDANNIPEWVNTPACQERQKLIIRNAEQLDRYCFIDKSERTYMLLVPFLREAQRAKVKRAYGMKWTDLLKEPLQPESDAHYAACMAVSLLAMSTALRRLPLHLIPGGVVRQFMSKNGMGDSHPASLADVEKVSTWLSQDAAYWIDEMKKARDGGQLDYSLLPKNDPRNKYCRL